MVEVARPAIPQPVDAVAWHRLHFGFTITFHYLFPQLTIGLALLILIFKLMALRTKRETYNEISRFWAKIFGINFAMGVVTGIPMEFQFGTNWARFSDYTGGVIGLTLAMEGMFAFFAESAFLGLFLFGEKKLGPRMHLFSAFMLFLGSWLSGYFVITTNSFMQHPVGHEVGPDGKLYIAHVWKYLFQEWAIAQTLHALNAAVITGTFVVMAIGAYWLLMGKHQEHARICLRYGVVIGFIASVVQLWPTGDYQGKLVARDQPATLAAMEGKFESGTHAELAIIGQPNVAKRRLENPVVVPSILSFLAYGSFGANVVGLNDIPEDEWPTNIELLYYVYHIMVGLGTIFILITGLALFFLVTKRLYTSRRMLWTLMLAFPFPYIANTAGWMTAELGRQPWLVYGLQRTVEGTSHRIGTGDVVFTLLGYMGLYTVLGILFLFLFAALVVRGPAPHVASGSSISTAGG